MESVEVDDVVDFGNVEDVVGDVGNDDEMIFNDGCGDGCEVEVVT